MQKGVLKCMVAEYCHREKSKCASIKSLRANMKVFREHVKSFTCAFKTFYVCTLTRKSNIGTPLHGDCVRICKIPTYVTTARKHTKYVKASMCIRYDCTRHREEKFHLRAYRFYFFYKEYFLHKECCSCSGSC